MKKKQCYHEDICKWNRDSFSCEVENYKENCLNNNNNKKENFKKDLMNLIEKNHTINMTPDHSISNSNLFKSHLNTKSFDMFSSLQQLCEAL